MVVEFLLASAMMLFFDWLTFLSADSVWGELPFTYRESLFPRVVVLLAGIGMIVADQTSRADLKGLAGLGFVLVVAACLAPYVSALRWLIKRRRDPSRLDAND
jgi:hypothetical protein